MIAGGGNDAAYMAEDSVDAASGTPLARPTRLLSAVLSNALLPFSGLLCCNRIGTGTTCCYTSVPEK